MTTRCDDHLTRVDLYLDGELAAQELTAFEQHIDSCPVCQDRLRSRQAFVAKVRASRPLSQAPAHLHERIAQLIESTPETADTMPDFRRRVATMVTAEEKKPKFLRQFWTKPLAAIAASIFFVAGIMALWTLSQQEARANAFVSMAMKTHRDQIAGRLPVELKTSSSAEVSDWFSHKVSFDFRLPKYQAYPGQIPPYNLAGARLVNFKGDYAAYVAYEMKGQPISLIVTSTRKAIASGGETTAAEGLTFHSHTKDGLRVATWTVHGLTYALVSSADVPARQSCVVCHPGPNDRHLKQ